MSENVTPRGLKMQLTKEDSPLPPGRGVDGLFNPSGSGWDGLLALLGVECGEAELLLLLRTIHFWCSVLELKLDSLNRF